MMRIYKIGVLALAVFVASCGNNEDKADLKDSSTVHPPSEAIPDSTKLVGDSVIMPDTVPGNGSQVGNSDSIQRQKQ